LGAGPAPLVVCSAATGFRHSRPPSDAGGLATALTFREPYFPAREKPEARLALALFRQTVGRNDVADECLGARPTEKASHGRRPRSQP
jgi:hypothetical protein